MNQLPALALAPAAQAWLAQTRTARVLNVFDRACNLVDSQGQVLSLVTSHRGLTPFAVVVVVTSNPAPFRDVTAASAVWVQSDGLALGPLTIDCSAARIWNATPDWPSIRRFFGAGADLDPVAALALAGGPRGSLLELFAPPGLASWLPAWAARLRQGAGELVAGLRAGSVEQCAAGAERLAGVGGGLTPAGDDFILGVLLAAWAGRCGGEAVQLGAQVAEAAARRTTTLSGAYLRAAARGECSAYWHELFEAWLQPDLAGLRTALTALLAVGHTSGADALAGFLAMEMDDAVFVP